MALRMLDSFDHLLTADLTAKWTTNTNGVISSGNGRRGTNSLRWTAGDATNAVLKTLDAQATWILGFAFKCSALPAGAMRIAVLTDAGSVQVDLRLNSDGTLSVTRNGSALTNGTSTLALSTGTYYFIEWKCTIANSIGANTCKVRVNGVDWLTVATGQDTQSTGNATANGVWVGESTSITGYIGDFDDLYICDGTGSECNDFLGDVRVDALFPVLSGTVSQFAPSSAGATGVSMVNSAAPDTATYLYASAVSSLQRFVMSGLASAGGSLYGVQLCLAVAKSDAGTRTAAPLVYTSATSGEGVSTAVGTSYAYLLYPLSATPTGASWTAVGVSSSEFGLKVTA